MTVAIAKIFAKEVRDAGSIPIVLMIPDRTGLGMHVGEKPFPLVQRLRNAGIDVIDMGPTFGYEVMKEGAARYYVDGGTGHNSAFGNLRFAQYLEKELRPWIEKAKALSNRAPAKENGTHTPKDSCRVRNASGKSFRRGSSPPAATSSSGPTIADRQPGRTEQAFAARSYVDAMTLEGTRQITVARTGAC